MIKIDYHGSLHGHFLEYVANVWIMQTPPGDMMIFNELGACHDYDDEYEHHRIIVCDHWSQQYPDLLDPDDQVIRIQLDHNDKDRFFIAATNLIYRAGDEGWEQQMLYIPEFIRDNAVALRNDWYSKFNESQNYMSCYAKFAPVEGPVFDFDFAAFFDYGAFCQELNRLAHWLNQCFFPDDKLYNLYQEFMCRNQGYQSWLKCQNLLSACLGNLSLDIDCTVIEEAWLNYKITKIARMYEGTIFSSSRYPTNTQSIYKEIQTHLQLLRNQP